MIHSEESNTEVCRTGERQQDHGGTSSRGLIDSIVCKEAENIEQLERRRTPIEASRKMTCRGIHRSVTMLDRCNGIRGHKLL